MKYYLLIPLAIIIALILLRYGYASVALAKEYTIAIFREDNFLSEAVPFNLTPEWISKELRALGYKVRYYDLTHLLNYALLDPAIIDLFILPYGENFPVDAFDSIKRYLENGGGIFTVGGLPFRQPLKKEAGVWIKVKSDPYKEFLVDLGIKYYESEIMPESCEFNQDFFKSFRKKYPFQEANIGITVATGDNSLKLVPRYGNVFAFRVPVRDYISIIKGKDDSGQTVANPAILVKSWKNPYGKSLRIPNRYCFITVRGQSHPLNPQWPKSKEFLRSLMGSLSQKISLHSLETDFACYYQGEKINFSVKLLNFGSNPRDLTVVFFFKEKAGKVVKKITRKVVVSAHQEQRIEELWHPKRFFSDFYSLEAFLYDGKDLIDTDKNGCVIYNKTVLNGNESFTVKGTEFFVGNNKTFISGTNYYGSKHGELIWLRPNMLEVMEDFQMMQKTGINFLRIHYHHSKWFGDYITKVARLELGEYFSVADNQVMPSERSLRILDAVIQLSQKFGLVFCMDIFTLVPKEMGEPIGWLGLKERIYDRKKIESQKDFVALLAQRYKNVPAVTWDLWNEPRLEDKKDIETLKNWGRELIEEFRKNGDTHPITIGDDLSLSMLDVLDYVSIHTDKPDKFLPPAGLTKPYIFQEVWNDVECGIKEELKQAEKLKKDFSAALKQEAAGFVPWQWTKQSRLWSNNREPEKWDDELGLFTHDDGTLKPAGRLYPALLKDAKK